MTGRQLLHLLLSNSKEIFKKRNITLAAGISELFNAPSPARQRCPPQAPTIISDLSVGICQA